MKHFHYLLAPLLVGIVTLYIIFSTMGVLHPFPDSVIYVDQIRFFDKQIPANENTELRSFKPFYGAVGSFLTPLFTPEEAILTINVVLYFGLILAVFYMLRGFGFESRFSAIGASWVAAGYPLLKYGLALLTDLSGWFFAAATITVFLFGMRTQKTWLLVASSCVAFIGSLCKETGVLGLGFAGLFLLGMWVISKDKKYFKQLLITVVPFIILQAVFLYVLFSTKIGDRSFIDWFFYNKESVGYSLYTWKNFILGEGATFHVLFLYILIAMYYVWKNKLWKMKEYVVCAAALFLAVVPPLVWPIFLIRVLYIGYLFVVPAALFGLLSWQSHNEKKKYTFYVLAVLPIVVSFTLFLAAKGGSLFDVLHIAR